MGVASGTSGTCSFSLLNRNFWNGEWFGGRGLSRDIPLGVGVAQFTYAILETLSIAEQFNTHNLTGGDKSHDYHMTIKLYT